jgi:SWI/SNF-related matrix-associated actin-dependent regulator 1 of chromatin subfamily A
MKRIEEFSDDEDYLPVSASRYFNKNKAYVEDHTNGTNGKASGVSISSADELDKSKKSVAELDKFAFTRKRPIELLEDDDDDDDVVVIKSATVPDVQQTNGSKRRRRYQTIDDSDDDETDEIGSFGGNLNTRNGAPDYANDEALAKKLQDVEYQGGRGRGRQVQLLSDSDEEEEEEVNPILTTLQRCDLIAASLRDELHANGSSESALTEDRYAEVDASAAKIVSQSDVCAACGIAESDTQRMLKPYQLVGVNFMLLLHRQHVGGAILADEMGLGKTVQAVAYLALLKHLDGDAGPHLLVAPASLLENWQRELKKWCPAFNVELYHGPGRVALNRKLQYIAKARGPAPFNVMLTCYSLFERQSAQTKDDRKFLKKWDWSCVVMDEAHLLKDRSSFRSKKIARYSSQSKAETYAHWNPTSE